MTFSGLVRSAGFRVSAISCAAAVTLALGMAGPASAGTGSIYGYVVTGSTYTSVAGTWNVPTPKCLPGTAYTSILVGLDGYTSPTAEQAGVDVDCVGGKAEFAAWYELYPANTVYFSNTVQPGDSITASVTSGGGSKFTVKLSDTTQGWSHTVNASLAGADLSSAEAYVQDPSSLTWSAVNFTGVTVDGVALGSDNPVKITGSNRSITVSKVTGAAFTVSWSSGTGDVPTPTCPPVCTPG